MNISFRDSGYKNIETWTKPFNETFEGDASVKSVKISITERWSLYMLRGTLANLMRNNTPPREHDTTLLFFGSEIDEFRDVLRMHNLMSNYVFLVDNLGRIRFGGSGAANEDDIRLVFKFATELSSSSQKSRRSSKSKRR